MSDDAAGPLGAEITERGVRFAVWSESARHLWLCLFDAGDRETDRIPMARGADGVHRAAVPGLATGARYGLRADGPWEPGLGHRFDPEKLLVDPYALAIDRPFAWDPRLALPRGAAVDTAPLVPKAIVTAPPPPRAPAPPRFAPGGLIYELQVRAFSLRHPDVPPRLRGTVAALATPPVLAHLKRLRVAAVELMPVTAWIDEHHLPGLGLTNAWGYNPVLYMAPDPRLCPGGLDELRATVATLHAEGIGVLLDVVFNHTGEGDADGPTLSLRGLDNAAYFRHDDEGRLINDTGTGNTVAAEHPMARRLILDAMRHFVVRAGIDGFRFDLGPIIGRTPAGFDPEAEMFRQMLADPVLADRILIAEPWDIGPGGYQLGGFPPPFLEWNDRFRDRVRRFWRGDDGALGDFATAVAGSSDVFAGDRTRTVNFVAAHDGFTLADLVAHAHKHNEANGEANADGHDHNISWNNGVEGPTADPAVIAARGRDRRALIATLFASRGAIMLTAGDEFGRTQGGNNNAYAQDNALTWLDWEHRDDDLEGYTAALAALRARHPALAAPDLLAGAAADHGPPDVEWLATDGEGLRSDDWEEPRAECFAMVLRSRADRVAVIFNRGAGPVTVRLPARRGRAWRGAGADHCVEVAARCVVFLEERPITNARGG